jgi:TRAP-type mannitol/chloroaromatic compound transport system permease small subunit
MPAPETSSDADAAAGHRPGIHARLWSWLVDGLAALGTVLIGVLMLIICADIVARNLMGSSLPLISELGALTLVMIVYLQLAATVRADRLARTQVVLAVVQRHHPRAAALLTAVFDLTGAALVALLAWATLHILEKDLASGEFIGVPGIATVSTWPFRLLILLGVTVAAVEFLVRTVSALRIAGGEGRR